MLPIVAVLVLTTWASSVGGYREYVVFDTMATCGEAQRQVSTISDRPNNKAVCVEMPRAKPEDQPTILIRFENRGNAFAPVSLTLESDEQCQLLKSTLGGALLHSSPGGVQYTTESFCVRK